MRARKGMDMNTYNKPRSRSCTRHGLYEYNKKAVSGLAHGLLIDFVQFMLEDIWHAPEKRHNEALGQCRSVAIAGAHNIFCRSGTGSHRALPFVRDGLKSQVLMG